MKVKIAKDITRYKDKLFLGLTLRQTISVAVALIINIPLYIFLIKYIGEGVSGYISILTGVPIFLFGWWEPQGMTFEKYLLSRVWSFITPPVRPYKVEDEMEVELSVIEREG